MNLERGRNANERKREELEYLGEDVTVSREREKIHFINFSIRKTGSRGPGSRIQVMTLYTSSRPRSFSGRKEVRSRQVSLDEKKKPFRRRKREPRPKLIKCK